MYKKQLKIQKIVCLLALVVAVILFLYSLGIMTDVYDTLYQALRIRVEEDPSTAEGYSIAASERVEGMGAMLYMNMQGFNKMFVKLSIAFILTVCLLYVTNTSTRRRYYITNYISIAIFSVASIGIAVYSHIQIEAFKTQWNSINFTALEEFSKNYGTHFTTSTLWFDLHYVVFALLIIAALAMIGNCVWKVMLMKEERRTLEDGKKVRT